MEHNRELSFQQKNNTEAEESDVFRLGPSCVWATVTCLPGLTSPHISRSVRPKLVAVAVATWVYVSGRPPRGYIALSHSGLASSKWKHFWIQRKIPAGCGNRPALGLSRRGLLLAMTASFQILTYSFSHFIRRHMHSASEIVSLNATRINNSNRGPKTTNQPTNPIKLKNIPTTHLRRSRGRVCIAPTHSWPQY
jgi:hypothetical protein